MRAALVLVDVQDDFFDRPGLTPTREDLIPRLCELLDGCRAAALPVLHVRTLVGAAGSDAMPHWRRQDVRACIVGTPGAEAPPPLAAAPGEPVIGKRFFSGFEGGDLDRALRSRGVDTVILAGLYAHGCIRATATDAYQLGYAVIVAADCVASTDMQHALITRRWLDGRAADYRNAPTILAALAPVPVPNRHDEPTVPVALLGGDWVAGKGLPTWAHHDPCDAVRVLDRVPLADAAIVASAVRLTQQAAPSWAMVPASERARLLAAWGRTIAGRIEEWSRLIAVQVGKPLADARDEMARAVTHVGEIVRTIEAGLGERHANAHTRHCPRGVVAVITPWNNPVAIPVAKIAAALAFGNGVVWKPALPAPQVSMAVADSLAAAGLPPAVLTAVFGDAGAAQALMAHPEIAAVTLTGSQRAGIEAATLCARRGIPLQAELGGNNAAIVMADADLGAAARLVAIGAFGFAGQRCTATRRIVIDAAVRVRFTELLLGEVAALRIGDPLAAETAVGPMLSLARRASVTGAVERAVRADGGRILCGGREPGGTSTGSWYSPTLVDGLAPRAALVQQETFGPVAVIQPAADFEEALALCNGVSQGLVASFFGSNPAQQASFVARAQAGILRVNPTALPVAADAPFGGWKSSGIGPPEHGRWDRDFFARPQAIYDNAP